jgi:hypothetical protein
MWFYCTKNGQLEYVYYEGTRTPLTWEAASGTCRVNSSRPQVVTDLPPLKLREILRVKGYNVVGNKLGLRGIAGDFAFIDDVKYDAYVFSVVDCTQNCGTEQWFELHTLLVNERRDAGIIGIFYLREGKPVEFSYGLTLPRLQLVPTTNFLGDWSAN